jgi:diguanylate cyclase (GGDEF)-like protein
MMEKKGGEFMDASEKEMKPYEKERYHLLLEQLQAITYEYDIDNDVMVFAEGHKPGSQKQIQQYRKKLCTVNSNTVHPDFLDKLLAIYMGQSIEPQEILLDFKRKGQDQFSWYRIVSKAICDQTGRVVKTFGVLWNIDEALEGEMALLHFRSARDPLTGLYNRPGAEKAISSYFESAESEEVGAILVFNIDQYQKLNETRGRCFGEQVLISLSREIQQLFRTSDIIAHVDLGQFIILMKNVKDLMIVPRKADKLRHIFDNGTPGHCGVIVPCRVGSAIFPYDGKDYGVLLDMAHKSSEESLKILD